MHWFSRSPILGSMCWHNSLVPWFLMILGFAVFKECHLFFCWIVTLRAGNVKLQVNTDLSTSTTCGLQCPAGPPHVASIVLQVMSVEPDTTPVVTVTILFIAPLD